MNKYLTLILVSLFLWNSCYSTAQNTSQAAYFQIAKSAVNAQNNQNSNDEHNNDDKKDHDSGHNSDNNDDSKDNGNSEDNSNEHNGEETGHNNDNQQSDSSGHHNNHNNDNSSNHNNNQSDNSNNDKNNDNSHANDHNPKDHNDSEEDHDSGETEQHPRHYYVGVVSANTGKSISSGGASVVSGSPWLPILMVGTWFEAYGYWDNDTFVADEISVPNSVEWSYYKGPVSALAWKLANIEGNIEAWIEEGNEIESLRMIDEQSDSLRLIAYYNGSGYVSFPQNLPMPPARAKAGWTEILGKFDGKNVTWTSVKSFP